MQKKRFTAEQIVAILKQAELGIPIAELIRQVGVSEQTFYRWKKKYTGLEVDQVRQLKQLREENFRLKRIVADLTLDKAMLQDVLSKKFKALAVSSRGDVHVRGLPDQRATSLPGDSAEPRDVSVPESQGSVQGAADADSRDRPSPSALRIPKGPGVTPSGGVASGKIAGAAIVPGRRIGA